MMRNPQQPSLQSGVPTVVKLSTAGADKRTFPVSVGMSQKCHEET